VGDNIIMKISKLKKKSVFSLIALIFCCVLLFTANSNLNIFYFINTKIELIKEKEMKFIFGEKNTLGDTYSVSSVGYNFNNVSYNQNALNPSENALKFDSSYEEEYLLLENSNINTNKSMSKLISTYSQYQAISTELRRQIEEDSYRNKKLGFYYIFNSEYTMDALKELEPVIKNVAKAQKNTTSLGYISFI